MNRQEGSFYFLFSFEFFFYKFFFRAVVSSFDFFPKAAKVIYISSKNYAQQKSMVLYDFLNWSKRSKSRQLYIVLDNFRSSLIITACFNVIHVEVCPSCRYTCSFRKNTLLRILQFTVLRMSNKSCGFIKLTDGASW